MANRLLPLRTMALGGKSCFGPGRNFVNRTKGIVWLVTLLLVSVPGEGYVAIHITHQYANLNAQSLIGLPMGSHKPLSIKKVICAGRSGVSIAALWTCPLASALNWMANWPFNCFGFPPQIPNDHFRS